MKTILASMLGLIITVGTVRADIIMNGQWDDLAIPPDVFPELMWMVTGPVDGYWTYEYWWDYAVPPAISHLIIEVSPGATLDEFRNFEGSNDGVNFAPLDPGGVELALHNASPVGQQPNPGMPEDLFGIKFDGTDVFGVNPVHIRFESMRSPVPGDFFAKGGSSGAYNDGFTSSDSDPDGGVPLVGILPDPGQDPQHIIRPNSIGSSTTVPEASSIAVWCVVGLTYAGTCCWRRRR